jgi:ribosomal protein S18 acetylase RimI-like enzyme
LNINTRIRTRTLNPRHEPDLQDALAIFQQAFLDPWSEDRLRDMLQSRNICGLLAGPSATALSTTSRTEADGFDAPSGGSGLSCGCLVYQCYRTGRRILSVGVLHDAVGLGYATALIRTVQKRVLQSPSPEEVVACIAEDNLPAQRCFQKSAFRHLRTLHNYYRDGRAVYVDRWVPGELVECGDGAAVDSLRMD